MAEIRPIRAWRYNEELSKNIDSLTSPLFDVVSERQRQALYLNPYNSIHLSVPKGEQPASLASQKLSEWKQNGVLQQDRLPGIYVYYQYFSLPGSDREFCRKGFIAFMRIYDWEENILLRHENTMPGAVHDRTEILEKTQMNTSPTHGLYYDTTFELEKYMDESMKRPVYESEDYQGVRDVLSVIHDGEVIKKFIDVLQDKEVILADGHHRYQSSLTYMKKRRSENTEHSGKEGYNYHMIYLTNGESDDIRVMPTHRIIKNWRNFDEKEILTRCEAYFTIKPVDNFYDIPEIILGKKWAFGLMFKENAYKIRLKPELIDDISWPFPRVVKELELTVLHYFFIKKVLGIRGQDQTKSEHIAFERNFTNCEAMLLKGEADMALIVKGVTMEEIKQVCRSGYTLPQKSTYFYPKVICGFLFGSIKEDEFIFPFDFSL